MIKLAKLTPITKEEKKAYDVKRSKEEKKAYDLMRRE